MYFITHPSPPINTQYGTRYAVQLSNFPPGSQVSLKLFRKQVRASSICLSLSLASFLCHERRFVLSFL